MARYREWLFEIRKVNIVKIIVAIEMETGINRRIEQISEKSNT